VEALTIDRQLTLVGTAPGVVIRPTAAQLPAAPHDVAVEVLEPSSFRSLTIDGRGDNDLVYAEAPTRWSDVELIGFSGYAVHGGGAIDMQDSLLAFDGPSTFQPAIAPGGTAPSGGIVRVRRTVFDGVEVGVRTDPGGVVRDCTFSDFASAVQVVQVDNGLPPARIVANDFLGGNVGVNVSAEGVRADPAAVLTGNLLQDVQAGLIVDSVTEYAYSYYLGLVPTNWTEVEVRAFQNSFVGTAWPGVTAAAVVADGEVELALNSNTFIGMDHAVDLYEITTPPGAQPSVSAEYNLTDSATFFTHNLGMAPGVSPTNLLSADPMYTDYTDDGVFADDFTPLAGSPLIDGGEPTQLDRDGSGTRADIGHHTWR